jgi:hypothetical protein
MVLAASARPNARRPATAGRPAATTGPRMPLLARLTLTLALTALAILTSPQAAAAAPTPAQAQADLDHLYSGLQAAHYDLFARRPRAEYDALHHELRQKLARPHTAVELRGVFQRFVAFGNVAHARIDPPLAEWEAHRAAGGTAFPLFLRVVGSRVFVEDDYSGVAGVAPGDEVLSIDGVPALAWIDRIRPLVSADNDYLAYTQMETQLPMLLWWHGSQMEQYDVEVAAPDGGRRLHVVPARSRSAFADAHSARPQRVEPDFNARIARTGDDGIGYLRPGPFYDNRPESTDPWDPTDFRHFIDDAFAGFIDTDAAAILIDLRNNPGGDNSFSDPMIAWFATAPFCFTNAFEIRVSQAAIESNAKRLASAGGNADSTSARLAAAYLGQPPGTRVSHAIPLTEPREGRRFTGAVYLLVNRHSYSNAVLVAAIAQDYKFATVLGEETADLASTYGAAEKFTLPETGVEVSFPKARILRPSGDTAPRGVIPDVAIPEPVGSGDEDVVLTAALRAVVERRPQKPDPS